LNIRLARLSDAPEIGAIHAAGINMKPAVTLQTAPFAEYETFVSSHGGDYPLYVAEVDGEIAAWACISPFSSMAGFRQTGEASWYVHPAFAGKGIGKKLAEHLIREAERAGILTNVVARIAASNEPSLRLARSLGFTDNPFGGTIERAGLRFGEWVDVVFFNRRLGQESKPEAESATPTAERPSQLWSA